MDKLILFAVVLNCPPEKAFEFFTSAEHLEKCLTVKADVEAKVGGKYELFWEPDDPENNSTTGCKILALDAPYLINFEWKGPKQYQHFMNTRRPLTNVTVAFTPMGSKTKVTLIHTGWGETPEWEEARQFFVNAWQGALAQLQKQTNESPSK